MENNEKEAYGKAIDLLMSGHVNFEAVCVALAKEAPAAFVAIHEGVGAKPEDKLRNHLIRYIKANPGKKVEAIKECRNLAGLGLKEAKDYIDALTDELARPATQVSALGHIKDLIRLTSADGYARGGFVKDVPRSGGDGAMF